MKMDEPTKNLDRLEKVLSRKVGAEWVLRHPSYLSVRPGTSEEVSDILKIANRTSTPVFPRGGGTGWWSLRQEKMEEVHKLTSRRVGVCS
jgi:FAD/FMN-containing dehydrogenase